MAKIHNEEKGFPERGDFVKKGTTLMEAEPFVYVLTSKYRDERCDNCLQRRKIFRCSGCRYVYYCSKKCQRKSWLFHKVECPNIKNCPMEIPDAVRMMARIIIKLQNGGDKDRGYYSSSEYRTFDDLMSHNENIKNDLKKIEHFTSLYGALTEFLPNSMLPSIRESLEIFGRMSINSFHILENETTSVAVGLYLGPSIIDHSCKANATTIFQGTKIIVRTVRDIPSFDWTKVSISYIDILTSVDERRLELKKSYYFRCDCDRCINPEPVSIGAACPNKNCTNPCFPQDLECRKCGEVLPPNFQDDFELIEAKTRRQLERIGKINNNEPEVLEISRMCLKEQEGVLHPLNMLHVRTLEVASSVACELNLWEEAEVYGTKLINKYEYYYGDAHPLTGDVYVTLANILGTLGKFQQAYDVARRALDIVKIAFGENSPKMQEMNNTACWILAQCEKINDNGF